MQGPTPGLRLIQPAAIRLDLLSFSPTAPRNLSASIGSLHVPPHGNGSLRPPALASRAVARLSAEFAEPALYEGGVLSWLVERESGAGPLQLELDLRPVEPISGLLLNPSMPAEHAAVRFTIRTAKELDALVANICAARADIR
jgi:hypothetical protein